MGWDHNDFKKGPLTGDSSWRFAINHYSCSLRYKYHFPFLEINGIVAVDDNRVGPLYKHIFPPALAPWLSFVGLPWKVFCRYSMFWVDELFWLIIHLIDKSNLFSLWLLGCTFPLVWISEQVDSWYFVWSAFTSFSQGDDGWYSSFLLINGSIWHSKAVYS